MTARKWWSASLQFSDDDGNPDGVLERHQLAVESGMLVFEATSKHPFMGNWIVVGTAKPQGDKFVTRARCSCGDMIGDSVPMVFVVDRAHVTAGFLSAR